MVNCGISLSVHLNTAPINVLYKMDVNGLSIPSFDLNQIFLLLGSPEVIK